MAPRKTRTRKARRPTAPHARTPASRGAVAAVTKGDGHSEFELRNEEIETALRTGDHAGLLEDYFGTEPYGELRQLAREAAARSVRGGPKVLILPGIMGSKIGRRRVPRVFDDVYWFDPVDIGRGSLSQLALPDTVRPMEALGVLLTTYLKLKLRLQVAGYDAEFHAFDWRRSIADLGGGLKDALDAAGGKRVSVVAHSMGGLVARWAIGKGAKCRRLVMLGTPNYGSFAPVQALRATYPIVKKVAALDVRHTAEDLARDVFSTFPGLTQLLPFPSRYKDVDLYDLSAWPNGDGLRPRKELLDGVPAVQDALAMGPDEFYLIAGVDQPTVTGLRVDASGFVYDFSPQGDGTVPLDFARMPGVKTYYVAESHGSLPNNKLVAQAVLDVLDRGATSLLPDGYAAGDRGGAIESVPERTLREAEPYGGRRGALLSQRELRTMLEEVASPEAKERAVIGAAAAAGTIGGGEAIEPGYRHQFDHVVVGRRRQRRVDLRFARGSITDADSRAVAVGIFRDVAPSGAARALDERLDGAITELSRRRMFSGQVGEVFMMPTGRHPISADLIAFAGLGPFDRFNGEVLQVAAENVIRTFVSTRVEEFATVLFGSGSGEGPASALRNLLIGFIRGLCDADRDHHFRRLIICEQNPERYAEIKQELYRLSSTPLCEALEFTFDEVVLKPTVEPVAAARAPRRQDEDPVYLIVRQEQSRAAEFDVRASLLTAGKGATVISGVSSVKSKEFEKLREELADPDLSDFSEAGQRLASMLLAEEVRAVFPRFQRHHVVVVHDAPMSRVPWETMALPNGTGKHAWLPAAEKGLSHRYAADNLSVAKWLEERVEDGVLTVLVVINPTRDLPGAAEEGERVRELLKQKPACRVDVLREQEATRPALLAAFGSGKYDVIHYAGHAFFDEKSPDQSGILCHGRVPLTGADITGLGKLPTLVFFNACESARVRRTPAARRKRESHKERLKQASASVGLAEAFMRGGVATFIGTYWPVGDDPAKTFAEEFYTKVMLGTTLGEAIQTARQAVNKKGSKDWADYIFYGNPDFVLKEAQGQGA